jgi:outer membrane protein OmpA-like peptidoglycan-associated protein
VLSASMAAAQSERPATTTFFGDTGLWYVPTAEVLAHGEWSISGYRRGTNYTQGYSNVADFAGTFAVGLGDRAEVFGSFLFDTRIDRDVRPLFLNDRTYGGFIDRNPRMNTTWSGNNVGDFFIGAKVNLLSQRNEKPVALAIRGGVKAPTGDVDSGVSTGKTDVFGDFVISSEVARLAELAGYAGYEHRGKPDGFETPSGAIRWGAGATFPSRSPVRGYAELNGYIPSADQATITTATLIGTDNSRPPAISDTENITRTTVGITAQLPKGFFAGVGLSWNLPRQSRVLSQAQDDPMADYWDWQVRIGYHPPIRTADRSVSTRAPESTIANAAPATRERENQPPAVNAQCNPCTVEVGGTSTITARGQDPDGDQLTYRWTPSLGSVQNPANAETTWTAPRQEGTVPVTVVASDGKGGTANDTVNIQVVRPRAKSIAFEDVHFDFDRYTLRPEATRALDEAVLLMKEDRTLKIEIDGHTCDIGTAEYNLALGDRRASAVRAYLISQGIEAERLETITYGEEMSKYDNEREETRRLNRRAALVVNVERAANNQ